MELSVSVDGSSEGRRARLGAPLLLALGGTPCDFLRLAPRPGAHKHTLVALQLIEGSGGLQLSSLSLSDLGLPPEGTHTLWATVVHASELRPWAQIHVSTAGSPSPLALPTAAEVRCALGVSGGGGRYHAWRSECLCRQTLVRVETHISLESRFSREELHGVARGVRQPMAACARAAGEAEADAGATVGCTWGTIDHSTPVRYVSSTSAEQASSGIYRSNVDPLLLVLMGLLQRTPGVVEQSSGAEALEAKVARQRAEGKSTSMLECSMRKDSPSDVGPTGFRGGNTLAMMASPVLLTGSRGVGKKTAVAELCARYGVVMLSLSPHEIAREYGDAVEQAVEAAIMAAKRYFCNQSVAQHCRSVGLSCLRKALRLQA